MIFSIGYATKPIELYIEQLQKAKVNVVADIRSVPYSNAFHDYHKEALQKHLHQAGIRYVYLGDELGPRSKLPEHYDETGQVQFNRLMLSPLFQAGIKRLFAGVEKGFTIALSCAEKDPAICHRSLLVGWWLNHEANQNITHILHDGELETQSALESRLLNITNTVPDMLMSEDEALTTAYDKQCQKYAYRIPEASE